MCKNWMLVWITILFSIYFGIVDIVDSFLKFGIKFALRNIAKQTTYKHYTIMHFTVA